MNIYFRGYITDGEGSIHSAQLNDKPKIRDYFETEEILFSEPISKKNQYGRGNVPPYLRIYKGTWHEWDYKTETHMPLPDECYILMMGRLHGSVTTNFKSGRIRVENRFAVVTTKDVIDNLLQSMAVAIA